jgi:hypothetical protein
MAAAFGHEAATWPKRAVHRGDHRVGVRDPMQHRVAEHGIKLFVERQRLSAHHAGVQAKRPRGLNLRGARIDADDRASELGQLLGERSVSAP